MTKGKKAIIVGASSGIGYEVARLLLQEGVAAGLGRAPHGDAGGPAPRVSGSGRLCAYRRHPRRSRRSVCCA